MTPPLGVMALWPSHHLMKTMSTMKPVVLVGRLSVAVALLLSDDTVVRCLACRTVGAEALKDDEAEVAIVDCCTDGVEALNQG